MDPAARDNQAIINAAKCRNVGIFKLLLADSRVDPSDQNNLAIINAAKTGNIEIVKLLVLLKTDAPSVLGIVITYQDGDGD